MKRRIELTRVSDFVTVNLYYYRSAKNVISRTFLISVLCKVTHFPHIRQDFRFFYVEIRSIMKEKRPTSKHRKCSTYTNPYIWYNLQKMFLSCRGIAISLQQKTKKDMKKVLKAIGVLPCWELLLWVSFGGIPAQATHGVQRRLVTFLHLWAIREWKAAMQSLCAVCR